MGVCAQTADFSVTSNFPVYDAWDGEICSRPAFIWFGFPSELSGFRLNYGKFERKTSGNWLPGIFGGLGVDPLYVWRVSLGHEFLSRRRRRELLCLSPDSLS